VENYTLNNSWQNKYKFFDVFCVAIIIYYFLKFKQAETLSKLYLVCMPKMCILLKNVYIF